MNSQQLLAAIAVVGVLGACSSPPVVRQQDLDAWAGVPAAALDSHPYFSTLPMVRTTTDAGVEIRDYVNKKYVGGCLPSSGASSNVTMNFGMYKAFRTCSENMSGCDNVFTIKKGVVVEFAPTGQCRTSEMVQPQGRYERPRAQ